MNIVEYPGGSVEAGATVVTVGNFDGVHRGHVHLLNCVKQHAQERQAASAVITFRPHTRAALHGVSQPLLATFEEKATLIEQLGIDYLVPVQFDREFASMDAETFIDRVLVGSCHAVEWIMGPNHTFGRRREGGKNFLHKRTGKNHISIFTANLNSIKQGAVISSTSIREALLRGDVEQAVAMLGRPYLVIGEHVAGCREGTRLGFPTLNFRHYSVEKVLPPPGVYAAELSSDAGTVRGALYYGNCPTFANRDFHFEMHVLDSKPPAFKTGDRASIWIHAFIRSDRTFSTREALSEQIRNDIGAIEQFFAEE